MNLSLNKDEVVEMSVRELITLLEDRIGNHFDTTEQLAKALHTAMKKKREEGI